MDPRKIEASIEMLDMSSDIPRLTKYHGDIVLKLPTRQSRLDYIESLDDELLRKCVREYVLKLWNRRKRGGDG